MVTLGFVGDIYAAERSLDAFARDARYLDVPAAILRRADLCFGNLEGPLVMGGQAAYTSGVRLRTSPRAVDLLRHLGIGVAGLANNHMADYGADGVVATRHILREAGIGSVGAGASAREARSPLILSVRGARVAFLAACDDEGGAARADRPGVWVVQPRALLAAVRQLRGASDVIVVSLHTGIEFSAYPEPYFVRLAHRLVDAGATIVIGHHPHVPQGLERYGRSVIAYSLGDFLFDLPRAPLDMTDRQRLFNALHPVLEVGVDAGAVGDVQVHWLTRRGDGHYVPAQGAVALDVAREFESLCGGLRDPAAYRRQVDAVYRAEFRDMVYDTPRRFCAAVSRRGLRELRPMLFWLGTWRKTPKRRRLRLGLTSWMRRLADRRRPAHRE